MSQSHMDQVETRTGRVALTSRGAGPPLVFLHAAGHDQHDFDRIAHRLSTRFRTITVDWPGFGASAPPADLEAVGVELYSGVLEDLLGAIGVGSAILLGNSIGGGAAVHLAAKRPPLVRGLVLVSSSGFSPRSLSARAFCALQGLEAVRRTTGVAFARWYTRLRTPEVDALLARVEASRRNLPTIATEAALWRSFGRSGNDLRELARSVRCPTLAVFGKYDPVIRASRDRAALAAAIPHAEFVELASGHVPFAEMPAVFLETIEPLLRLASSSPVPREAAE